jgi:hypothetical protein
MNIEAGFVELVSIMGEYLQHFLICMHEFNNNIIVKKTEPFLSIADFCTSMEYAEKCDFPCVKRAVFFVENGTSSTFILKNYSSKDVFAQLSEVLAEKNISIIPENHDQLQTV